MAVEDISLAEAGPLNQCVLSLTLPEGYSTTGVEKRYDRYWDVDLTGPPTIVTSKTQAWQEPETYESVPDTMSINVRIETIGMVESNMTAQAHAGKASIAEVYEEGDLQIDGHDAHYVLAAHTYEPTGHFTSYLQSGCIAIHLGAAWCVTVESTFYGDRLDVETEDFVLKTKVGDTPIIEKHQENLVEVLGSVAITGWAMGASLEPPETPEGWELVGYYYDVNNVEMGYWGLGMATKPGEDPPDLLHVPRIVYVRWNGMTSDEFVKWVYRPIDRGAAQLQVKGESPFYIVMRDGQNRTTGWLAQEGRVVNEIPGAVCTGIDPSQVSGHPYEELAQEIRILQPAEEYAIDLVGTGEGRYRLTITGLVGANITSTERKTGTITKDALIEKRIYAGLENGELVVTFPDLTPPAMALCCGAFATVTMMKRRRG